VQFAVIVTLLPLQILVEMGEMEIVGIPLIVTVVVAGIATHPPDAGIV
jgi:hypothetical protein